MSEFALILGAAETEQNYRKSLNITDTPLRTDNLYMVVVTEVYYTRALDVTFYSSNSFGGRVAAGMQVPSTQPFAALPASATIAPTGVSDTAASPALAALQSSLNVTQSLPGGSVQLVSFSDSSIGLRRVFDRPVAIGYRGMALRLSRVDGKLQGIAVMGGITPSVYMLEFDK